MDYERLLYTLFTRDFPTVTVLYEPNMQPGVHPKLPAIVYSLTVAGETGNGPDLWVGQIDVTLLGTSTTTVPLSTAVHRTIHKWANEQTGIIAGVGHVQTIDDISAFVTGPTTAGAATQTRAASYAATFRPTPRLPDMSRPITAYPLS